MLQLRQITKEYTVGESTVQALRGVSIDFRPSEFVAVLGPSGCGKTTLLNIVGGLDSYSSGDLVINGISTRDFDDAQWDAYRNHSVGFVFQSYNLIPHQTVLANVELALKLGHVDAAQRTQRAMAALEKVGLAEHAHKRPNMLSGGQMQRVAIARALVNDPSVILADEPTGALDSQTSLQVMDLLKEVAADRLVVMVTHNPELAEAYATRIVRLKDGQVVDDSNPVEAAEKDAQVQASLPRRTKLKMSTALGLSLNNLRTKKGRTFLTAFAGAIGIIGIALILALSNGVNTYITDLQRDTMASYPITIEQQAVDLSSIVGAHDGVRGEAGHDLDGVYSNNAIVQMAEAAALSISSNNLVAFKEYLDADDSPVAPYLGANGVVYSYETSYDVFTHDLEGVLVDTDGVTVGQEMSVGGFGGAYMSSMARMGTSSSMSSLLGTGGGGLFAEMLRGAGDQLVSPAVLEGYDVLYGGWPTAADEVVLIVDEDNEIALTTLYELGMLPSAEYGDLLVEIGTTGSEDAADTGDADDTRDPAPAATDGAGATDATDAKDAADAAGATSLADERHRWDYADLCDQTFYLLPASAQYVKGDDGAWKYVGDDAEAIEGLIADGAAIELTVVGVVRASDDTSALLDGTVGFTSALTDLIIERTDASQIVREQLADPATDVFTGKPFASSGGTGSVFSSLMSSSASLYGGMYSDYYDAIGLTASGTLEANLSKLGVVDRDEPSSISIYADTFEDKDAIGTCIEQYNEQVGDEGKIVYTDFVGLITSSVTTMIDTVSYVLIAFVSISLIVSSIMIAIITYISVLERTKEIGVLRALGASKGDVSKIFNAETLIEGLLSGVIGVAVAALLCIPANILVEKFVGVSNIAILPWQAALVLVAISVVLTLIAGFIPSRIASKKDPAVALRTE